jgi:hypothetical protein
LPLLLTNAAVKGRRAVAPCGATSGLGSSSNDGSHASVVVDRRIDGR